MKSIVRYCLLGVVGIAASAQVAAAGAIQTSGPLADALKRQADRWDAAIVAKDRDAIAANMADSFVQIDSDGQVADKAGFLADITSKALTIAPYTVEDFRIRIYGDTAVINGRTAMHGTYEGKPFTSHYRFTDTYVKEAGGWRAVNIQTTRIAPAAVASKPAAEPAASGDRPT